MNFAALCCFLVLCVTHVFSVTISSPTMQRKSIGESCTFRWNVAGNFTTYIIKILSTGSPTALGSNTNHTFNSSKGLITLFIWKIQTSNAGNYSLSISTGPSTEVNSVAVLFVYATGTAYAILAVGRNPGFEGDKIEFNCSAYSNSLPAAYITKMYYFWYNSWYGYLRNISSGLAVLQNGDVLPRHSIKNDGKTLVISSVQNTDSSFFCSVQEEGSPFKSGYSSSHSLQIYGKPCTSFFIPASRKFNAAFDSSIFLSFNYRANPPLISYTNWSFINAAGSIREYSVESNPLNNTQVYRSFILSSANSYGIYSITLTNSYGSTTETFHFLPPGPPESPSIISVQYVTHSFVSIQWRCMWYNGLQQTVFVRLMDVANNVEVETQTVSPATNCYNLAYSTLFQNNIQPETNYEASIWSTNTRGSSDVVKLPLRSSKRLIFVTSPANISIVESQATISFRIADSTKVVMWLNVTCCIEITTQCSNKAYLITKTDNQIVFDILPTGNEYVFDFTVYDSDGYTYVSTLAIVKGLRVSRTEDVSYTNSTTYIPCDTTTIQYGEKENPLLVAVIVLAVLFGVAVLALIGCLIGFLVCKCCQKNFSQQSAAAQPPLPKRSKPDPKESSEYANAKDLFKPAVDLNPSKENAYYKSLEESPGRAKQSSGVLHKEQSPKSSNETSVDQENIYEPGDIYPNDDIFYTKLDGTLDRPKRNRYQ